MVIPILLENELPGVPKKQLKHQFTKSKAFQVYQTYMVPHECGCISTNNTEISADESFNQHN